MRFLTLVFAAGLMMVTIGGCEGDQPIPESIPAVETGASDDGNEATDIDSSDAAAKPSGGSGSK